MNSLFFIKNTKFSSKNAIICAIFMAFLLSSASLLAQSSPLFPTVPFYKEENIGAKIIVNIPARRLDLYEDGLLIKSYVIAVGKNVYKTPVGSRELTKIIWNPWWHPPKSDWAQNESPTPPGLYNPLGPVKMDLGNAILIHGTTRESSIGTAASHGCVRMKNSEVVELARYLQENYTLESSPELFETYAQKRSKSFYVSLPLAIPVEIVYDLVEIQDHVLYVHQDVYYKFSWPQKKEIIKAAILNKGYTLQAYDLTAIFQKVLSAKNKDTAVVLEDFAFAALSR